MPNSLSASGLTIQTIEEIFAELKNGAAGYPGFLDIYGPSINVEPNSPDGQQLNIWAQGKRDTLELVRSVYASFDPTQAVGTALDQRCAINGVFRKAGTRTLVNLTVTSTQGLVLAGLDTAPDNPFTAADSSGNRYQLVTTTTFSGATTLVLGFQAVSPGPLTPADYSVVVVVTVTLGLSAVFNAPGSTTYVGTTEESDAALRLRRARSVALPSRGFFDGLYGALLALDGVTSVSLLENTAGTTDANGIPGHSIWAVVAGGANDDVANAIYLKRNAGCGLKGGTVVNVNQADGSVFPVKFDRPTAQNLWAAVSVHPITGTVDTAYLKAQILAQFTYAVGQVADATAITAFVKGLAPNAAVTSSGVSADGTTVAALLSPTATNYQFALNSARVTVTSV